jgi:hypothetical protein
MSKLNTARAGVKARTARVVNHPDATTNVAGGLAFKTDAKTRLYKAVVTSLVGENKFYTSGAKHDAMILKDIQAVAKQDPEWILKLASYARNEMYLRSVAVVLLVEASHILECRPFVRQWTPHILKRADEPKEALAYALNRFGRPVHIGLRRGIADAMLNFDEYQLTKYDSRRKAGEITMVDVLRLAHPRPQNKSQEALFGYLLGKEVDGDLILKVTAKREFDALTEWGVEAKRLMQDGHVTWEVAATKFGNNKAVWESLDLPYMAALRNLRNMIEAGADITKVLEMIRDPEQVKRAKQLPFRFFAAAQALGSGERTSFGYYNDAFCDPFSSKGTDPFITKEARKALGDALEHSVSNIPALPGRTLVMVDISGSMSCAVSKRSDVCCRDIACLFGAAAARRMQNTLVVAFADNYKFVDVSDMRVISGMKEIMKATDHTATYAHKPINHLTRHKTKVDRIVLLSDMQCYTEGGGFDRDSFPTAMAEYKAKVNANVKLISIDLQGHDTSVMPQDEPNVALLSGWSERIFNFVEAFDRGALDASEMIAGYEPRASRRPYWTSIEPVTAKVKAAAAKPTNSKGPYSLDSIAEACGVTRSTVQKWVRAGKLTVLKRNGAVTVSRTALAKFIKASPRYKELVKRLAAFH